MPIDRDTYRKQSLDTWAEMASGWEEPPRVADGDDRTGQRLAPRQGGPQPGETILEIAAGLATWASASRSVSATGPRISTDFAPEMSTSLDARASPAASPTSTTGCWTPKGWTSTTTASTGCSADLATCPWPTRRRAHPDKAGAAWRRAVSLCGLGDSRGNPWRPCRDDPRAARSHARA